MKKKLLTLVVVSILVAFASSAWAAVESETFTISPFIGGYMFDGVQSLKSRPVYGIRGGYNFTENIGLEAVFDFVATKPTKGGDREVHAYNYRLEGLYHFMPAKKLVPFIAIGAGGISVTNKNNNRKLKQGVIDYGAGVKYALTEELALRGDVRHLITTNRSPLNNLEYTVGITYAFGGAKPAPTPVAKEVIPEPIAQEEPKAATPAPMPPPEPTSRLAVTPGAIMQGRSATLNWSSQNATNCEIQPDIGPVRPQGSMTITPTADTTYTLTCTGEGGTTTSAGNIQVTAPPPPPKREKVCIVLKIEFDTGKAVIKPKYHTEIGKVAEFMKQYQEAKGTIEGHTDNVGGHDYNMKLSEQRAASVRNYLNKNYGIAPERLSLKGYGLTKPIANNKTREGRQKNRRIQATFDCIIIKK
ncbi:MAG: OmpA family protein [Geobacteraceae bacterium]